MNGRPQYFDAIRERAAKRWDQLEGDPELAGPWHQLFKQVQSPRHILSELLQNADDAGATEAAVRIESHCFIFTHNGEDFSEEHFASLCRFGYSNKRALHTIGFRGIGFKSTFSLGNTVCISTPTLSVAFERQRFTEPKWINGASVHQKYTEIRVPISDNQLEKEAEKNLLEWQKSPVSLLFFKHIRRLKISDHEMHWASLGPGPVSNTEWMALHDNPDDAFLLVRSLPEAFPPEALSEIKQERLLGVDQEADFPPCRVEIVLGAEGRLYVVLPTGVETELPFACNAPFIQDPARLKIKEPEISPTNRWLLERIGSLAASVMLEWLGDTQASLVERSRAYDLLPDVDREDSSLEGVIAATVEEAFADNVDGKHILITNAGDLTLAGRSVILPEALFDIWRAEQVAALFDNDKRPALSRHISETDREKLIRWGLVEHLAKDHVLTVLQSKHLPKPVSWRQLLKLWAYVAPDVTGWHATPMRSRLRVVPVQGKNVLYSAGEVVRLSEKRLLQSEADWEFLSSHLLVLNQNWPRFISEQRREGEEADSPELKLETAAAQAVLKAVGLEESSDVSKVIEQVASGFFAGESVTISNCVQLAQIAAKLGSGVGDSFRFVVRDRRIRPREHIVLFDEDGTLEQLLPASWCSEHLLHQDYSKAFTSCTAEEWRRWVASGRSGLLEFPPLKQNRAYLYSRLQIEGDLRKRGASSALTFPYKTSQFIIEDWNFDEAFWQHWAVVAKQDDRIWGRILERILLQPESFWSPAISARAVQVATTGSTRAITNDRPLPTWILKFRDLPCLPDTREVLRKPDELLRRTPKTESLMDVEFFLHGLFDKEATRTLLNLLGVRSNPTGPGRLLDCVRALSQSDKPPIHEVEKWYRRLDQMLDTCSTIDTLNIKQAFQGEKIILTEGAGWAKVSGVYLSSDEEDVPSAAIIRASVRDLALWRKLGVAERPTANLAIQWLKELPTGSALSQEDARRVRALLTRHPGRIWHECGHWLNLAREWAPTATLEYALTMQTLTEYSHLHEWVKQKTADFQRLPTEVTEAPPFSDLPRLAHRLEDQFHQNPLFPGLPEKPPWLIRFGEDLSRIEIDDESEQARVRTIADALANTVWRMTPTLEVIPYLNGAPAGTPRRADVVWLDRVLFVEQLPKAKLARIVPERLGKAFGRIEFTAALNYCFGRSAAEVTEYLEENFKLAQRHAAASSDNNGEEAEHPDAPALEDSPADGVTAAEGTPPETTASPVPEEPQPEEPDATQTELDGVDDVPQKGRNRPKPARLSIVERFARSLGFQKDSDDRFFHADGSWIGKVDGIPFPWERRTARGDLVRQYWAKDHCLEHDPLQIDADMWGLVDKFPETYAFILSNPRGDAVEISGTRLLAMREGGELVLYPASYRLVRREDGLS